MIEVSERYQYRVGWTDDGGEYVGQCLEFPSLSWLAPTYDEAFAGIRNLVRDVVSDMLGNDEQVPQPLATREYSGKFLVRIPVEVHRDLAMRAAENGVSLNLYVNSRLVTP